MKHLTALSLSALLAAGAVSASAADNQDRDHLAICEEAIASIVGPDAAIRLNGIQYTDKGNRLRMNVYPVNGPRQGVNCWVGRESGVTLQAVDGVAFTAFGTDDSEQITLVD